MMKPWPEFLRDKPAAREWLLGHIPVEDVETYMHWLIYPHQCLALIEELGWHWDDCAHKNLTILKGGCAHYDENETLKSFAGDTRHQEALQHCLKEKFGEPE